MPSLKENMLKRQQNQTNQSYSHISPEGTLNSQVRKDLFPFQFLPFKMCHWQTSQWSTIEEYGVWLEHSRHWILQANINFLWYMAGSCHCIYLVIRQLFVSQGKETLATWIIFIVTNLTSLTFASWNMLNQPSRKCTLWGHWEAENFSFQCASPLILTVKTQPIFKRHFPDPVSKLRLWAK